MSKKRRAVHLSSDSSTGQPFARRGDLYNMTTATLGSSLVFTSDYDEGKQSTDSICPRGWQLSYFDNLLHAYGITVLNGYGDLNGANRIKEWPLQFLPTGDYYSGYVRDRMTDGYWWTDAVYSEGFGYRLASWTGSTSTEDDPRGWGFALREVESVHFCVFIHFPPLLGVYKLPIFAHFRQSLYDHE